MTSGFTGVYLFGYSVHYFVTKLQIVGHTSTFLYFGYTGIMVLLFSLLTGKVFSPFHHLFLSYFLISLLLFLIIHKCSYKINSVVKTIFNASTNKIFKKSKNIICLFLLILLTILTKIWFCSEMSQIKFGIL